MTEEYINNNFVPTDANAIILFLVLYLFVVIVITTISIVVSDYRDYRQSKLEWEKFLEKEEWGDEGKPISKTN